MTVTVFQPSREELRSRRERLLGEIAMTREQLEREAELGSLSGSQYWTLEDIRSIEFLLGDDIAAR